MAGLEGLLPLIYHERQQSGSLLCAQHALNSLLQGNYFTAPDLSELAHHLDHLEQSYNEDIRGQASANMDDTGFFSVQVLEEALHVWGLSLVRWRSETMKPFHDRPHARLAFVLNQNQHWYTLRRFGKNGHWFNLDSTKPSPQWISKTYLGMFLQQAEQEGYSTFAIVPIDSSNAHPLPRCDADDAASTLPEPSSASSPESRGSRIPSSDQGFGDEDMDLQAALQASLASAEQGASTSSSSASNRPANYPLPVIPSSRAFPGFPPEFASSAREGTSGGRFDIPPNQDRLGNADVDPVSASMERNRIIMERMRQQQEAALREQYDEEVARFGQAQERDSRQPREAEVEDEDELFRRAMEESLAEHRARGGDDEEMAMSDDEEYYDAPTAQTRSTHMVHRVYDDDDAELQAALKASLETIPPGFTLPPSASPPPPQRLTNDSPSAEISASRAVEGTEAETEAETEIETEAGAETETETETETTETDAEGVSGETAQATREEVSIEEMRRRRLARFGG